VKTVIVKVHVRFIHPRPVPMEHTGYPVKMCAEGYPAMKVLLVEDSKFLRVSTERALTKAGYEVVCAADGEEALRLAREHLPALVLLDIMLPKISGPDVLKALKQDQTTLGIPVMMLTSLSQKNAKALEKDGAAGFFEKSDLMLGAGPGSLLTAIAKMLQERK
jgi:CheY-like chemotaxis protein